MEYGKFEYVRGPFRRTDIVKGVGFYELRCPDCGETFLVKHNKIKNKKCPVCSKNKTNNKMMEYIEGKDGYEYVRGPYKIDEYKRPYGYYEIRHIECGNIFEIRSNHFMNGSECPFCKGKKYSGDKSIRNKPGINQKIKNTRRRNSLDRFKKVYNGFDFLFDEYTGRDHDYPIRCKRCGKEFEGNPFGSAIMRCPDCDPYNPIISSQENDLYEFIDSIYDGEIIRSDRTILDGKELDILIPDKKIAFEYNGLYWHSNRFKENNYHLNKTNECSSKGIQLIHIFSDEWENKKDIIKSMISSKLGLITNKIYARKCKIKNVNGNDSIKFLNDNHIQGGVRSKIKIGLYEGDELVALMTIGIPRYSKEYMFELLRYSTLKNTSVIGGFSRLLKHFYKTHSGVMISYADRRFSNGNVYEKNGFILEGISKPNYYYIVKNQRETRIKYQKHKLGNILESFNSDLSENENMFMNGFYRIFDSGNMKYSIGE